MNTCLVCSAHGHDLNGLAWVCNTLLGRGQLPTSNSQALPLASHLSSGDQSTTFTSLPHVISRTLAPLAASAATPAPRFWNYALGAVCKPMLMQNSGAGLRTTLPRKVASRL